MKISKKLGIFVTDEEIINTIQGPNPPQIITQYFIDSTGNFNRQAYDQDNFDPNNKEAMLQTEALVREQLLRQKLTSFLNSSVFVVYEEVRRQFMEKNVKMSADYILIYTSSISDSQITVADSDLREYYKNNIDNYEVKAQRKVKYVLFSNAPTRDDSLAIIKNLTAIVEKLAGDTSTFKTYVEIYSDQPYSVDTTTLSRLSPSAAELISESKKGDIIGPVLSSEGYVVYKLNDMIKSKETLARASHILIKAELTKVQQRLKLMKFIRN